MGEPNAKNLLTSKSNITLSTDSTDKDIVSKLNVCCLAALLRRRGEIITLSSISSTGGAVIISSVSGSTFSRMFPLLRLSLRLWEFSRLLLQGGVWLLIRRGFLIKPPFESTFCLAANDAAFGESVDVFVMKLWVRLCVVLTPEVRAS